MKKLILSIIGVISFYASTLYAVDPAMLSAMAKTQGMSSKDVQRMMSNPNQMAQMKREMAKTAEGRKLLKSMQAWVDEQENGDGDDDDPITMISEDEPDSTTMTVVAGGDSNPRSRKSVTSGVDPERAFQNVLKNALPMDPEQIVRLRERYNATQQAAGTTYLPPPRPVLTSLDVGLAPGTTPPVIRLSQGYVSSLLFLDSTGAPWPIKSFDIGNPRSFNIQWDKKSNILMIQAKTLYPNANLAVKLVGLSTPVILTLVSGQRVVDYRIDLRVAGIGPLADPPATEKLPNQASSSLLDFLNGVPPSGSQSLTVKGGEAKAWLYSGKLYLRTDYTLLSPGWVSKMTSADGTHIYELQKAPLVLVSRFGKPIQLTIEGL